MPHGESQEPGNKDQGGQEQQPRVEAPGRVAQEPDHVGTDEPAEVPAGQLVIATATNETTGDTSEFFLAIAAS